MFLIFLLHLGTILINLETKICSSLIIKFLKNKFICITVIFFFFFTAFVTIGTLFDVGVWYFVKDVKIFDEEIELKDIAEEPGETLWKWTANDRIRSLRSKEKVMLKVERQGHWWRRNQKKKGWKCWEKRRAAE